MLYGLSPRNYSFENILNLPSTIVIDGSNIVSFFCYIRNENSNYGSLNIEVDTLKINRNRRYLLGLLC